MSSQSVLAKSADAGGDLPMDHGGALDKLRARFEPLDFEQHASQWDDLWLKGDFLPWDRAQPSPALIDAFKERSALLKPPSTTEGTKKRALVPGCGRGYDVLLLASLGYDVTGLDVSDNALEAARKYAATNTDFDRETPGSFTFVKGDFFAGGWEGSAAGRGFDLIYDYTFLCALPPSARPMWARRMSELLAKHADARLVCLEFPSAKPPASQGPPFGLNSDVYLAHLTHPGEELSYNADGYPDASHHDAESVKAGPHGVALERLALWRPDRTFKAGKDTDMMSVWSHKQ